MLPLQMQEMLRIRQMFPVKHKVRHSLRLLLPVNNKPADKKAVKKGAFHAA